MRSGEPTNISPTPRFLRAAYDGGPSTLVAVGVQGLSKVPHGPRNEGPAEWQLPKSSH